MATALDQIHAESEQIRRNQKWIGTIPFPGVLLLRVIGRWPKHQLAAVQLGRTSSLGWRQRLTIESSRLRPTAICFAPLTRIREIGCAKFVDAFVFVHYYV